MATILSPMFFQGHSLVNSVLEVRAVVRAGCVSQRLLEANIDNMLLTQF